MSTTGGMELGTVGILDSPDVVARKLARLASGTERPIRPRVQTRMLLAPRVLHVATGEPIEAMEARYDGLGYRMLEDGKQPMPSLSPARPGCGGGTMSANEKVVSDR